MIKKTKYKYMLFICKLLKNNEKTIENKHNNQLPSIRLLLLYIFVGLIFYVYFYIDKYILLRDDFFLYDL